MVVPIQPRKSTRKVMMESPDSKSESEEVLDLSILLPHVSFLEETREEKVSPSNRVLSPLGKERRQPKPLLSESDEENVPPERRQVRRLERKSGPPRAARVRRTPPQSPCAGKLPPSVGPVTRSMARKLLLNGDEQT